MNMYPLRAQILQLHSIVSLSGSAAILNSVLVRTHHLSFGIIKRWRGGHIVCKCSTVTGRLIWKANQSKVSCTDRRGDCCVHVFFGASASGALGNVTSGLVVSDMVGTWSKTLGA
jgi:hypothetical protein